MQYGNEEGIFWNQWHVFKRLFVRQDKINVENNEIVLHFNSFYPFLFKDDKIYVENLNHPLTSVK